MTRHDDSIRLRHMLDHAKEAVDMTRGKTRSDLGQERQLELSLVRLIEIVGEAATRVSQETQQRHPTIPWPDVIGMRHRLIHGYDEVDLDILWETIQTDLPPLIAELDRVLELSGSDPK